MNDLPWANRVCLICQFYEGDNTENEEDGGVCHRYPPKILVFNGDITSELPEVDKYDFCGEWKLDEDKK
jgi:hypothetical protein